MVDEDWEMYTELRDGKPYAYRYGEPWVACQLFMEGGYKTKKEAVEKWFEYLSENKGD